MRQLSISDLGVAAGTSAETARRFVELGIVEADPEGTFSVGDVRRIRLVLALATSGVPYEAVGDAIRSGRLSLGFVDHLAPAPIPLLPETQSELVERVGMSAELARRLTKIFGTSALPPDAQVRADHADLFELVAVAKAEGVPDERLVRVVRVTVEGMRRVVDAHRDFIDDVVIEPLVASGATSAEILSAATGPRARYRNLGRRLVHVLLDRLVDEAIFQHVVVHLEAALADQRVSLGGESAAIAFMDVSGYTRLAEEAGDEEAAAQAARFIEVVEDVAVDFGGRLVKVLGDGVMTHFGNADEAVRAGVELVARVRSDGLPRARVGINVGPMIRRDGDYFGAVVNLAARTADYARPLEVLVTEHVVDAWTGGESVRFEGIGGVALKNVPRRVDLYQALPAGK